MSSLAYVISTRMRVARNLHNHSFPYNASEMERQEVLDCIRHALRRTSCFQDSSLILLDRLSPLERKILEEQHLISHLCATPGNARAAIVSKAQNCSILINEEDHLRIQAFASGLALRKCRRTAFAVEQCLKETLQFAFSKQEGYLTSCSQNSGTGIRISAMLFLPGLFLLNQLKPIVQSCSQDGYTVRGAYGEGSRTEGYLLQLSLQAPQAFPVEATLRRYAGRCRHFIFHERMARMTLLTRSSALLRERVRHAAQQLEHAQRLSLASSLHILAIYRLGVCVGLKLPGFQRTVLARSTRMRYLRGLDRLSQQVQAAHIRCAQLQASSGARTDAQESHGDDTIRAMFLRERLEAMMSC